MIQDILLFAAGYFIISLIAGIIFSIIKTHNKKKIEELKLYGLKKTGKNSYSTTGFHNGGYNCRCSTFLNDQEEDEIIRKNKDLFYSELRKAMSKSLSDCKNTSGYKKFEKDLNKILKENLQ